MLVLTRKKNEQVMIGDNIVVTLVEIRNDKVRLGFDAPAGIQVHRKEVYEAINRDNLFEKKERARRNEND